VVKHESAPGAQTGMSTPRPLVTIAIPTHNRAGSYMPQALASALGQSYPNIEIIVSDNCSTDTTPQLIAGQCDARLRYYRHDVPMTPNDNFNFCLAQAHGQYFLLLLDDELVDREFVAACMDAAQYRNDVGLIRTGLRIVDANGRKLCEVPNQAQGRGLVDFFLAWFDGKTALYLCNTLFNTELLRSCGGLRSRHNLFQDVMAQVSIAAVSERVDIRSVLASTRSHPAQFTYAAKVRDWAEDALDLLQLMTSVASKTTPSERVKFLHDRGVRFFARICYSRAATIRSPWERVRVYFAVYRLFDGRCLPPARLVLASTAIYRKLRAIKRWIKGQPTWTAAG